MVQGQPASSEPSDPRLERMFIERERNRFAGRALAFLVLLNGAAALVVMTLLAQAPASTVDPKIAVAMMFFSGGAIAALFSSFLAYLDRTFRMQHSSREKLIGALSGLAIAAVIGSGTAFVMGMNMVAQVAVEKTSSHPKGPREDKSGLTKKAYGGPVNSRVKSAHMARRPEVRWLSLSPTTSQLTICRCSTPSAPTSTM